MTDTMELNNVDYALTPNPELDEWDDDGERSEDTGTAGKLTWDRPADPHFAAAHATAAALREQRRRNRGHEESAPTVDRKLWFDPADEFDYQATLDAMNNGDRVDYWHGLELMKIRTRGLKKLPPKPAKDEWREIPGFPVYVMHSRSREVWRVASGKPARKVTPRNGSYTLSNGRPVSRGINVLYRETFPELFPKKKRKREVGEWDDTIQPIDSLGWESNGGVAEWLASGSARIVEM